MIEATDAIVQAVAESMTASDEPTTPETVRSVLNHLNAIQAGEPLETVKRDPVSGNIATRVCENGINVWSVTHPDGTKSRNMEPTLPGWTALYTPPPVEDAE